MKEMLIESRGKYSYQTADGTRTTVTAKKAMAIFTEWKNAGMKIRRKYGMGGQVTWVWPE